MKKYMPFILTAIILFMVGCSTKPEPNRKTPEAVSVTSAPDQTRKENDDIDPESYQRSWMAQDSKYWYTAEKVDGYCGIYTISKNDESRKLIYQAEKENYIISNMALDITEDRIYFLLLERENKIEEDMDTPFKICTIKKDGSSFSVLLTKNSLPMFEKQVIRDLDAQDHYLLLKTNERTLVWYDIHSEETKTVGDIVTMFGFRKDKIYYISNWSLCVADVELKEKRC